MMVPRRGTAATTAPLRPRAWLAPAIVSAIVAGFVARAHHRRRAALRLPGAPASDRRGETAFRASSDTELTSARDAAEAANLAKTRYLVGVSHEIRSPLNAIYGYAQLLDRPGGIAPEEAGRVIRRASEHLINIVDGLLDISRIESGVVKLARDIVPLPAFLEQIAEMFAVQAREKGLAFHYAAPANLPGFVRTDEKRLRQILINLLSNAIKYTPTGAASLTVRYRGLVAEFEIADTGIGIAPDDLERIFEPFERGSSDTAHAQPGTGLGLAITRVLAQVMGGEVTVQSTPGEGSRFVLRLMLAEPGEAPPATTRHRPVTGYAGIRRTILIIDDDPAQLAVLQNLLTPMDFAVYVASGGVAGLDLARHCRPDLVLLDIQMPGVSGWQVARQLRDALGGGVKILLVSANAHEFAAGNDGAAAHDGFVLKPVALDLLLDAIAAQLGLAWHAAGDPAPAAPALDLAGAEAAVAELRRLGQLGDIRRIEARLAAFARDVPASGPLIERLREPVRAFDLKAFLKLLDSHAG